MSRAIGHALVGLIVMAACGGPSSRSGFDPNGSSDDGGGGAAPDAGAAPSRGDAGGGNFGTADAGANPSMCPHMDSTDHDGDGFSFADGDCDDCDPNYNPGAFDVPKDGLDEDCNGVVDDEPTGCDMSVPLAPATGFDMAKAMDLCRQTTETAQGKKRTWGVVSAKFVAPDYSDTCTDQDSGMVGSCSTDPNFGPSFALGFGDLSKLGVNPPRQGKHMGAVSSGSARDPSDPGYHNVYGPDSYGDYEGWDKGFTLGSPPPYPKDTPACPGVITGQPHDGAALELVIRVPTNANSFTVDLNFFTIEFPFYVCSQYNDSFVIMMTPKVKSLPDDNIAFDQAGNIISVNNSLLQVCDPQSAYGKNFPCPLGSSSLKGTGFGADLASDVLNHAATGWLQTTAPIDPSLKGKDITLLFTVWDSGDGVLDSTVLLDNFQWSVQPASEPITQPAPNQ
jgi:hypothetical protein